MAELLARDAATAGIDLVIMSTHGRTGLGRLWNGSEADVLMRTVKVPVMLLRPHTGQTGPVVECWDARRILIPLDGSERAEAALKSAVELGWLTGARYTLLQVVRPPVRETYAHQVAAQLDEHEIEHELLLARSYLESVANRLRLGFLNADTLAVVHGNIAQAIEHKALEQRADMSFLPRTDAAAGADSRWEARPGHSCTTRGYLCW